MRPFAATNAPDTCRWCGKKLRRPMTIVRGPGQYRTKSRCCKAPVEPQPRPNYVVPEGSAAVPSTMRCSECGGYPGRVYPVISKTPRYPRPGDYGDGNFCGLTCGYSFAVAMASRGHLLQPVLIK